MGMLHNARYLVLAERASSAFFEASGWRWERDVGLNPDQHYVVRERAVQYLEPVTGPCDIVVEMWVDRLGETSAAYGFEVRSADGARVHARLQRVHVKLDPAPPPRPCHRHCRGIVSLGSAARRGAGRGGVVGVGDDLAVVVDGGA